MTNKKILIVEDEPATMKALVDKLESVGFKTLKAKNGKEGIRVALEKKPDLILLDLVLPVMDGITMLKNLRQNKWGKDVLIIILTNLSDPRKVVNGLHSGVRDFLVKTDWTLEDVIKKVKERLK